MYLRFEEKKKENYGRKWYWDQWNKNIIYFRSYSKLENRIENWESSDSYSRSSICYAILGHKNRFCAYKAGL